MVLPARDWLTPLMRRNKPAMGPSAYDEWFRELETIPVPYNNRNRGHCPIGLRTTSNREDTPSVDTGTVNISLAASDRNL